MVRVADASRSTTRSPCQAPSGVRVMIWALAAPPGGSCSVSSKATVPGTLAAPRCTCTRAPERKGFSSSFHSVSVTSKRSVASATAESTSQSPRCTASLSMPASATAQRWPACACCTGWFCACRLRTRTCFIDGTNESVSATRTLPWWMVPVTTVPVPPSVKLRSTARRNAFAG